MSSASEQLLSGPALEEMFAPPAVTIVGASERAAPARYLLGNLAGQPESRFQGRVHLVNRKAPVLHGIQAVSSTAAVEGAPGLAFLLLAPGNCVEALEGFAELPTGVVVYSSGAESGFADVERELAEWSKEKGVPLLGPQSTGIVRPAAPMVALTAPLRAAPVQGDFAVIFQSAGLLGGTVNALWQRGIGFHTAVSIGNAAVLGYAELGEHLLRDPEVRGLAMYVDSLPSIDPLIELARYAQEASKPIVLAVGGKSEAGSLAVQSHTGELASSQRVIRGVAEQFGIVVVEDTDELVWTVEAFATMDFERPPTGGVGIFSTSGGGAIMLADAMEAGGVELPLPTEESQRRLSRNRPVVSYNPFDVGAAALDDVDAVNGALETFAGDPNFAVLVSVATVGIPTREGMEAHLRQTTDFVATVRAAGKQPLIAAPVAAAPGRESVPLGEWPGVPLAMGSKEAAVKARSICAWAARPDVGAPAAALAEPLPAAPTQPIEVVSGPAAEAALASLPGSWPAMVVLDSPADLDSALERLSLPLVAKVEANLAHRAARGGVLRGLDGPAATRAAVEYMFARFGGQVALIEEVPHDLELVIGFQRDERNGPLLMFGLGGGSVGSDVDFFRLSLNRGQAEALVRRYVSSTADGDLVVAVVEAFQELVLANPAIVSLDLNPLVVEAGSVHFLDAKIHLAAGTDLPGAP